MSWRDADGPIGRPPIPGPRACRGADRRDASITKAFGAVSALVDVDLVLYPGEILGLVGDNSAGKSTLMKILTGAYQRDSGDVVVGGAKTSFRSPAAPSASR